MKHIVYTIIMVCSFWYFVMFALFTFTFTSEIMEPHEFELGFFNGYWFLTILVVLILSSVSLGKEYTKEYILSMRRRMLLELKQKEQTLIDYIKLARLITKKDTEVLVVDYIKKIEKTYELEGDFKDAK